MHSTPWKPLLWYCLTTISTIDDFTNPRAIDLDPTSLFAAGAPTSVLFVGARCGEEVVCAGGILRRFASRGARVTIVALARRLTAALALGASAWESPLPAALQASAEELGAARFELLDMPEPPLLPATRVALQAQLAALIRVERPQLVLTHGPALRTAAVDRRAAVALVDGAIVAAATDAYGQQPHAPQVPSHEIRERWLFVSHDGAAIARGRAADEWGLTRTRGDWLVFDATTMRDLKWRALRGYVAAAPSDPPAELAQLLGEERFLRVVNPTFSVSLGTRRHKAS
jgi:LmbE family N-acetylglucosaminyl deacetylase